VTRRQQCFFIRSSAMPDGTDRMNHVFRRQTIAGGNLCLASLTTSERSAVGQQFWPRRAMDCAINAAAAEKRRICGVDDRINRKLRDVSFDRAQDCPCYLPNWARLIDSSVSVAMIPS